MTRTYRCRSCGATWVAYPAGDAIERDAVAIDARVETASKFLRMVQRTDGDYEATIALALARFASLMER